MKTPKTLTIRKKRYKVVNKTAVMGKCDHPLTRNKVIQIPVNGDTLGELTVILHEMNHAAFWDLDEEVVDDVSADLARALWKLGWRKEI